MHNALSLSEWPNPLPGGSHTLSAAGTFVRCTRAGLHERGGFWLVPPPNAAEEKQGLYLPFSTLNQLRTISMVAKLRFYRFNEGWCPVPLFQLTCPEGGATQATRCQAIWLSNSFKQPGLMLRQRDALFSPLS